MQGKSVLPLTQKTKPVKSWRKSMYYHYYEYPDPHRVLPHLGIRTERYKLILFYGDGSHSWELFDIKNDPDEMHNIYGQPSNRKLTSQLKKELNQLMIQYKDKEGCISFFRFKLPLLSNL